MENKVGAGFVTVSKFFPNQTSSFGLPDFCTVFQAEIMAILQAARELNLNYTEARFVRFFVDSQAALLALKNDKITSQLVSETKIELNEAGKNRTLILCLLYTSPSPRD